jgi:hypothetical protein
MSEEIDRWVRYMKEHPDTWKREHTRFINAQFEKAEDFMKRLLKEPNGREKIIKAYDIKNISGYKGLLEKT